MADKTPEQEPSIEEILASIRQIISDDDDKESDAPEAIAQEPVVAPASASEPVFEEREDDVLELTEPFEEDAMEIDMQEHVEPPAKEEVKMETTTAPRAVIENNDILTETAKAATVSSMAKLAGNMPLTRHREYGNITLEDLVREMLHPMLKDWLSDNLPPMVERMVQKELEKLARQAQDV